MNEVKVNSVALFEGVMEGEGDNNRFNVVLPFLSWYIIRKG